MVIVSLMVYTQGADFTGQPTKIPENNINYYQGLLGYQERAGR